MARVAKLKKIRHAGVGLIVIGGILALLIFNTEPLTSAFKMYLYIGTILFEIGALMYFAYEVFVPEFWRGEWAPGSEQEYPPETP